MEAQTDARAEQGLEEFVTERRTFYLALSVTNSSSPCSASIHGNPRRACGFGYPRCFSSSGVLPFEAMSAASCNGISNVLSLRTSFSTAPLS